MGRVGKSAALPTVWLSVGTANGLCPTLPGGAYAEAGIHPVIHPSKKPVKPADKPGSVVDSHSSGRFVT